MHDARALSCVCRRSWHPAPACCRPRRLLGTFTHGVSGMQGPPNAHTLEQSYEAIVRTSVTLRVRASQHTRGSLPCFLGGALCYPQGRPRIPGCHEPLALVWVAPAHVAGAGLLYQLYLDRAMRVPNASRIDFEELRQVEVLWTTP